MRSPWPKVTSYEGHWRRLYLLVLTSKEIPLPKSANHPRYANFSSTFRCATVAHESVGMAVRAAARLQLYLLALAENHEIHRPDWRVVSRDRPIVLRLEDVSVLLWTHFLYPDCLIVGACKQRRMGAVAGETLDLADD